MDVAGEVIIEVNGEAKIGIGVGFVIVLLRRWLGRTDMGRRWSGQRLDDKVARTGWPVG